MLCWSDGRKSDGLQNHIIQIGIVEVDALAQTPKITREESLLIRPIDKNFEVSDYCTELTGITRAQLISKGRYFPDVMRSIKKSWAPQNKMTQAWGSDFEPIASHCTEYSVPNPWVDGISDFGMIYRAAYGFKHKTSLEQALYTSGLTFQGKPHDALNDAKNLAFLAIDMMGDLRKAERNPLTI